MKYDEAKVDRLVAILRNILKTYNCSGGDRVEYSKQPTY